MNLDFVGLSTFAANCGYNLGLQEAAFLLEAEYKTWLEFEHAPVIQESTMIFHKFASYFSHYPNALVLDEVIKWMSKYFEIGEQNMAILFMDKNIYMHKY